MKPYYEKDGATIYHGDCLELIASGVLPEMHAVIMDPPYASGGRTEAEKVVMKGMQRPGKKTKLPRIVNDAMTTTGYLWLMRSLGLSLSKLLVEGGAYFVFIDWRNWPQLVGAIESIDYRVNGMIVWDKMSWGLGAYLRKQHELICAASRGAPLVQSHHVADVLRFEREETTHHPSPKPVGLMERLVAIATTKGEVVFDPFMGSGATLVAGKAMARTVIGCDVVEEYCELSARRLDQTMRG